MKTLAIILVLLTSLKAFAASEPGNLYKARYEVLGVKTEIVNLCAPLKPNTAECIGKTTKITVGATLNGCTDKLIFSKVDANEVDGRVEIFAVGIVETDLYGIETKCFMANTVYETIEIQGAFEGEVNVINREISEY